MEGLTGGKSDFRDLEEGYEAGDQACIDAIEVFCYNVARFVGAYAASLNGVDVIAFTAGIGENSGFVRGRSANILDILALQSMQSRTANVVKISSSPHQIQRLQFA